MNFDPINTGVVSMPKVPVEYQEDVKDVFVHTSDKKNNEWFDSRASQAIASTLRPYAFNLSSSKIEALKEKVKNVEWADEKDKQCAFERIKTFDDDKAELMYNLISKMEDLPTDLKKAASLGTAAYYCGTSEGDDVEKIKNFSAENYNKLNEDLRKNYAESVMRTFPVYGIEDPEGINKLYEVLDDEARKEAFSSILFLLGDKDCHETQTKRAEALLPLNSDLRQKVNICDLISKTTLTPNVLQKSVEYLNNLPAYQSSNLDKYYLSHLLQNDYSYSLDNAQNEPVCGTEDFKKFHTKDEMKRELASMRDENGKFAFSNGVIDKIINNENDIGDLSVLLDGIQKSDVKFEFYELKNVLMTEGLTLKNAQSRLDFISEVNKNPEFESVVEAINSNKPEIISMGGKDFDKLKNNLSLVRAIESYYPEIFKDNEHYTSNNATWKFRILNKSVVTPENFEKLAKIGFISNDFDLYRLEDILKDDSFNNIKDENIEFYNNLKNDRRFEFLFFEEKNGEKKPKDTSYILKAKLPEGFDISKKEELMDFIVELRKDGLKTGRLSWEGDYDYFKILLSGNNDEVSYARQIKDFLQKKNLLSNCDMYKFFEEHSFKETMDLIKRYEANPLTNDLSPICRYSTRINNDLLDVLDYAKDFDELKGVELRASDVASEMEYDREGKLSVEHQKEKINQLINASKLMPENIWQTVRSYAFHHTLTDDINFIDDNVKYFSDFYENEELAKYFNLSDYNLVDLMQMPLDIEGLRKISRSF